MLTSLTSHTHALWLPVQALFERFHALVTSSPGDADEKATSELGKLAVFAGVCEFPARVKCASLAWHTMKNALEGRRQAASTE